MFLNSLKQLFVRKESTINLRSNPELETTLVNSVLKDKEFLTLISIGFFGVAHRRWGGAKSPPPPPPRLPKICHTYPTMIKLGTVTPYQQKDPKNI